MPVAADLEWIRAAFRDQSYLLTTSGFAKMQKKELSVEHIEEAIGRDSPEIVEDYPEDPRGSACLVLGWADLVRPLHVVVGYGPPEESVIEVVTVYEPEAPEWYNPRMRGQR